MKYIYENFGIVGMFFSFQKNFVTCSKNNELKFFTGKQKNIAFKIDTTQIHDNGKN